MAIITTCGSGKNKELIHSLCKKLEDKGHIVLTPPLHNIDKYASGMDLEGKRYCGRALHLPTLTGLRLQMSA